MNELPYSAACARNAEPILRVLAELLPDAARVLEIGSGTGQHAALFSGALPGVFWQSSDLEEHHAGILGWLAAQGAADAPAPLSLDVLGSSWPEGEWDAVFSANTAHIMSWRAVEAMLHGAARVVRAGGWVLLYGPFSEGGRHTSPGNARFDAALRARDPSMGVRDRVAVCSLAAAAGLVLAECRELPANNRMLVWRNG